MLKTYEESSALWDQSMDKSWRDCTQEEILRSKHAAFFLKIWDTMKPRLAPGEELITKLAQHFPTDHFCSTRYPLGEFKDLADLTHKEIYDQWVARYYEPLINVHGRTETIANYCGRYMMKKWREETGTDITVEEVSIAMSLRLLRGSAGMIAEDRAHKELTEIYSTTRLFTYTPAGHEDENTGVDGYSKLGERTRIHQYSLKSFRSLLDQFIIETRTSEYTKDGKLIKGAKLTPTHYAGYESPTSKKLTFKEVDPHGNIVTLFGPPIKR